MENTDPKYDELKKKLESLAKRVDLLVSINKELLARYAKKN